MVYPLLMDVSCFSHTLDLVGEKFAMTYLKDFMFSWVMIFSHSPKACLLWRTLTGYLVSGYSLTRWWSKWEVVKHLVELYGNIETFLRSNEGTAHNTKAKLLSYFNDAQKKVYLQVEAAIVVDVVLCPGHL